MKNNAKFRSAAIALVLLFSAAFVHAATPSQADIDQMTADITGTNTAGVDSGVANLRAGIKTGRVSVHANRPRRGLEKNGVRMSGPPGPGRFFP